jgi:hypothetical protein
MVNEDFENSNVDNGNLGSLFDKGKIIPPSLGASHGLVGHPTLEHRFRSRF